MKKTICLLLAILLAGCIPTGVQVPQSPLLSVLKRKAGLIAYIGIDGNVYVSDQGGGNLSKLTDDAAITTNESGEFNFYQLPTWSQDGNQLAFVGTSGTNTNATATLFVANIADEKTNEIYSSKSEYPIYLYWSPDNANVSFISTSVSGASLILQNVPAAGGSERTIIDTGSPYYWSWAPNGRTLITHSGGAANSTSPEHLAFIQLQDSDGGIIEDGLDTTPASFQAPAWSPDGSHILMTRVNDKKKNEIIVTDGQGKIEKPLGTFAMNTAFAWSDQSDRVAYIEGTKTARAGVIGTLHVVDVNTSDELFSDDDDVIAFFWSPNGEKIAYFVLKINSASSSSSGGQSTTDSQAQQQILLQLKMLDVESGESKDLLAFQPTDQFLAILPYFDQYHQSATIWSPDNFNLVLPLIAGDGTPSLAIVPASGQLEPRIMTQGYLAFWSRK
jgi:TolB protein